jgi:hypothetical protein
MVVLLGLDDTSRECFTIYLKIYLRLSIGKFRFKKIAGFNFQKKRASVGVFRLTALAG